LAFKKSKWPDIFRQSGKIEKELKHIILSSVSKPQEKKACGF
jgi:hypothetical protein